MLANCHVMPLASALRLTDAGVLVLGDAVSMFVSHPPEGLYTSAGERKWTCCWGPVLNGMATPGSGGAEVETGALGSVAAGKAKGWIEAGVVEDSISGGMALVDCAVAEAARRGIRMNMGQQKEDMSETARYPHHAGQYMYTSNCVLQGQSEIPTPQASGTASGYAQSMAPAWHEMVAKGGTVLSRPPLTPGGRAMRYMFGALVLKCLPA